MKRSSFAFVAFAAPAAFGLVLAAGSLSPAVSADAGTQFAFGGPGYGMGPGGGRGGFMMGHRGAWPGAYLVDADRDGTVTVAEVKEFIESRHSARGFANFKVGEVTEADENTITAKIVDTNGNVIRTLTFPRKVDPSIANAPGRGAYSPGMIAPNADPGFRMGVGYGLQADGEITVDEIKGLLERRITMWNNPNLKVGAVTEKDENTITAEIVTKDGSLVQSMEFDRKTGRPTWNR